MEKEVRARVTMFIQAQPEEVYRSFVEPSRLQEFWLAQAAAPLRVGQAVHWKFMVKGAEVDTVATTLNPGKKIAWEWEGQGKVSVDFEALDGGTAVTLINDGFPSKGSERVEAALNATEGFAIVLADLKTLLESGTSAGITKAKAKLVALRAPTKR